jgi:transcriptional regulator with GAF, ATPase, and Fis domain
MVVFDQVSPATLLAIGEASGGGRVRAIAIATTQAALGDAGVWRLLQSGACDVLVWDEDTNPAAHVAARLERWARVDEIVQAPVVRRELVGGSPRWLACLRRVAELAVFSDAPVLLLGESGTGKELLARLVHSLDPKRDRKELVVLDCTTVVPQLSGSEFFGHERGAFTGATGPRDGAFALADGGTLFLDEVGELPLSLQAQLLRVVQERTYKRIGSNVWQRTDFRLVCATHRDLSRDVKEGRFRADLYHRIASRICRLPRLCERREDVLPLARHFLREGRPDAPAAFDGAVARYLVSRDYAGNVRELKQLVGRIGDRHVGPGPITVGDIPEEEHPSGDSGSSQLSFDDPIAEALQRGLGLRDIGRMATETAVRLAIACEEGNLQRAAKRLGVTDRALQMRRAQREDG